MCGRASLTASPLEIEEAFELAEPVPGISPRYNIAPTQPFLAVREGDDRRRIARFLKWGLVRSPEDPRAKAPINLRAESAAKGALRNDLRERRCVVPLTGFYEWRRSGRMRQPYNIRRHDGRLFGVAGVWHRVQRDGDAPLETCLVLTAQANRVVAPIHGRMPLILDPASYGVWLGSAPREPQELFAEVRLLSEEALQAYPVSSIVNTASVDDPRCLERVSDASLW